MIYERKWYRQKKKIIKCIYINACMYAHACVYNTEYIYIYTRKYMDVQREGNC